MILTCPACETKYVVKDGAIPPGGRQVRCASCKHSWHQDPESSTAAEEVASLAEQPSVAVDYGDAPPAMTGGKVPTGEPGPVADDYDRTMEDGPSETAIEGDEAEWEDASEQGETEPVDRWVPPEVAMEPEHDVEQGPAAVSVDPNPATERVEEEFVGYAPIASDEPEPRRRWPLLLGLLLLIVAAAAAFWFLGPPEWKARAGIAEASATPLQLMITTSDRQPLESGNELVAISGRVINPTDVEQPVPPISAELRDKQSRKVVHRWTIAPPARVLAPRSSTSFNSAEVDVPKGGDELTVTLGG